MKTRYLKKAHHDLVKDFPNFHKSGSISGMKELYYGKDALLVKCGDYIYNVTANPCIYYMAKWFYLYLILNKRAFKIKVHN